MTGLGYSPETVGEKGPQPKRGVPKIPFSTRIHVEHAEFLDSLPNKAGWLERVIDEHPDFISWGEARRSESSPAAHWCDMCRTAYAEAERLNSSAPIVAHLREVEGKGGR